MLWSLMCHYYLLLLLYDQLRFKQVQWLVQTTKVGLLWPGCSVQGCVINVFSVCGGSEDPCNQTARVQLPR